MNTIFRLWRAYQRRRYLAWLRRNRVILPAPKADEGTGAQLVTESRK